jgi:hypothetical protein
MRSLLRYALDYINRLEKENEELKYKVKKWKENYECSQVIVGDFREIINKQAKELKTAKAEAYKEFAEELIENSEWLPLVSIPDRFITVKRIYDLLKEKIGE